MYGHRTASKARALSSSNPYAGPMIADGMGGREIFFIYVTDPGKAPEWPKMMVCSVRSTALKNPSSTVRQ